MEGQGLLATEDISARIMRRARCLNSYRYSTDAHANAKLLEEENAKLLSQYQNYIQQQQHKDTLQPDFDLALSDITQLTRLWRWIALVEDLCRTEQRDGDDNINSNNSSMNFSSSHSGGISEEPSWTAKGLQDAGILKLLRMSSKDGPEDNANSNWMDSKSTSDILFCDEFDSPMRRCVYFDFYINLITDHIFRITT
jgi:hypothetical protein